MKKKLKINDVRVSSFVTNLDKDNTHLVKGGSGLPCNPNHTLTECLTGNYPTLNGDCTGDVQINKLTTNGTIC